MDQCPRSPLPSSGSCQAFAEQAEMLRHSACLQGIHCLAGKRRLKERKSPKRCVFKEPKEKQPVGSELACHPDVPPLRPPKFSGSRRERSTCLRSATLAGHLLCVRHPRGLDGLVSCPRPSSLVSRAHLVAMAGLNPTSGSKTVLARERKCSNSSKASC